MKVKRELEGEESSISSYEEDEGQEEDKYEPDLDLEADFPQGRYRLCMQVTGLHSHQTRNN